MKTQEIKLNSDLSEAAYIAMRRRAQPNEFIMDAEARHIIYREFGFDTDHIKIVHSIPYFMVENGSCTYCGSITRNAIHIASDFNYIRFRVRCHEYEMINSDLHETEYTEDILNNLEK